MFIYDGKGDKLAQETTHTVQVVSAGLCALPMDHMTVRQQGRMDISLFYVKKGKMHFGSTPLNENQLWIYNKNVFQQYTTYKTDNTVYYYLHFTGNDSDALLNDLALPLSTPISARIELTDIFDKIIATTAGDDGSSRVTGEYLTLKLLTLISKTVPKLSKKTMMHRVTEEMSHCFPMPYDVKKFAKMYALSESRFNHIFKETVGVPPKSYYNRLRMENACLLLQSTDLSVGEIALSVGFSDPLYFGQAFKRFAGVSPTEYRKKQVF